MVLGGLWFSDKKPVMSTFLKPFRTSLEGLETKGTSTCNLCKIPEITLFR